MNTTTKKIPADYLAGLKENWNADALSGFLVFLIAMPLSLGIAKASEFPTVMGLLTAIIGGVLVSFVAGSRLTIKGPAAGLIVIVSGAVTAFGGGEQGWHFALGTIVVAGVVQILFGVFRLGSLSEFFPTAVIHGMLAAIGLIIFSKQIYTLVGVDPKELAGMGPLQLYAHIPHLVTHGSPKIALIGLVCLLVVFGLPQINNRFIKRIPSPVIVLVFAIPMAFFMDFKSTQPGFSMVKIGSFIDQFKVNVDFSGISQVGVFVKYVVLFALIGSIESLLTVKAIDGLDPFKRKSNYNKDLIAVGIGNVFAGVFGGLPMISEVARSSANVNNGAKTRWANFFHGLFLLIAVIAIPFFMEMIPNAALAALLIGVGYRLASPKEFIHTYKVGSEQLVIFVTTIFFTLAEDLLIGVFAGIAMKFLIEIMNGASLSTLFSIQSSVVEKEKGAYEVKIESPATFSNLISFKNKFEKIPKSANVTVDFAHSKLADHTFLEMMHRYEEEFHDNGGRLTIIGFENHHYSSLHPQSSRRFLNNPTVGGRQVKLSKRQLELGEFAQSNNLEFEPKIASKVIRLSLSPFILARKAKNIENLLVGNTPSYNFFFADVYLSDGAYLTNIGRDVTIVHLSNVRKELPDFTLEKEGLLDLLGFAAKNDIDFDAYPQFSNRYYLTGEQEEEVRALFTPELITFFEGQNNMYVECVNNSLLVHTDVLLDPKQLATYSKSIDKMMSIILN